MSVLAGNVDTEWADGESCQTSRWISYGKETLENAWSAPTYCDLVDMWNTYENVCRGGKVRNRVQFLVYSSEIIQKAEIPLDKAPCEVLSFLDLFVSA